MKINAISVNDTNFYNIRTQDKDLISEIRSVYCYDPESATYLCEITPSYDLRYLYSYIVWSKDPTEDEREELWDIYCSQPSDDTYMHVSRVKGMANPPPKECGEFDDMNEAIEYLNGNCPF